MTQIFEKYIEELLKHEEVKACIASHVPYTIETLNNAEGFPVSIVFRTINPVRFIRNGEGDIVEVRELKND